MSKPVTRFMRMQTTFNFLAQNGDKKLSPERWAFLFGFDIIDWDGWRHHDCHEEIDLMTFVRRVSHSTINPLPDTDSETA